MYMNDIIKLDPMLGLDNHIFEGYDPYELFHVEINDVYIEIVTVDSVINGIRKVLWYIGQFIKKMINGANIFTQKRMKTPNQIAKYMKLHRSNSDDLMDKNLLTDEKARSLYNSFVEDIENGVIYINPYKLMKNKKDNPMIKGKNINGASERVMAVLECIIDPEPLIKYIEFMEHLFDNTFINVTEKDIEKVSSLCNSFMSRTSTAAYINGWFGSLQNKEGSISKDFKKLEITIAQLMEFQRIVDRIANLSSKFDDVSKNLNVKISKDEKYKEKYYMKILNELSWVCTNLQGGLNALCNNLEDVYYIKPSYFYSIDNPDDLASFVDGCIKAGIPAKYTVYNIYHICSSKITGNINNDNEPIMGFGRLTLIPKEGNIVYKVALNGYGIRSNKNDLRVMKSLQEINDDGISKLFAKTSKYYGNYIINEMEKVNASNKDRPSLSQANRIAKYINNIFEKNNVGYKIVDIKKDAFGKDMQGNYVILDYGYLHRLSMKGVK